MTPSEFKAWFDGFTEAFTGTPTKAQWARIKARVAEVDGKPVTQTVYVDRYLPSLRPYWTYMGIGVCGSTSNNTALAAQNTAQSPAIQYDSHKAMLMAGRAEAQSLAA